MNEMGLARPEIFKPLNVIREESYLRASNIHQNYIKRRKGESQINITNFIRRFAGFDALIKFHESEVLRKEDVLPEEVF